MHNDIDRDLYEILGVKRGASAGDVKAAYRKRAREVHPDVAHDDPDGEHKFKELTFAYEVLSDPSKRRDYDAYGLDGLRRGAGMDFDGFSTISDLFDVFFGGGVSDPFSRRASRGGNVRGRDIETVATIKMAEVVTGAEREIDIERRATCRECDGSGLKPGTDMRRCADCGGSGQVRTTRRSLLGTMVSSQTCSRCRGAGQVITAPCATCGGSGLTAVSEKIQVSVPPGVERGDRLRVRDKGEGGVRGGATGDLYVVIDIEPQPGFERSGTRLFTSATVDIAEAALGTEVDVDSLDGNFPIKVPPGTQPGDVLKAKGQGLPPRYGGRRGDVLVRIDVSVPRKLNSQQKELLQSYLEFREEKVGK